MFDAWSKNNEQKCWADLQHEASFWFILVWFSFLIFVRPPTLTEALLFSWCSMARCREHRQRETFKKHTSHTNTLFSTATKKKKKKKYCHVIYTAFTRFPRPKEQTYIYLSTAHLTNLQCPFGSLFTTPQTSLSCQQCYKESIEWQIAQYNLCRTHFYSPLVIS